MEILFGILITLFGVLIISLVVNRFYYSWTDYISLFACTAKTTSSFPNAQGEKKQKLNYFTNVKFSYESLHSYAFTEKIKSNPQYTVERRFKTALSNPLCITRIFKGGSYKICFDYEWRYTGAASTEIYDGINVSYEVDESGGVPDRQLEKNLGTVINELPLDKELRDEMNEKLSLEFSTQAKPISFF